MIKSPAMQGFLLTVNPNLQSLYIWIIVKSMLRGMLYFVTSLLHPLNKSIYGDFPMSDMTLIPSGLGGGFGGEAGAAAVGGGIGGLIGSWIGNGWASKNQIKNKKKKNKQRQRAAFWGHFIVGQYKRIGPLFIKRRMRVFPAIFPL